MKKRRDSLGEIEEVRVAETVAGAFDLADDVKLAANLSDPEERNKGVYQPFNNRRRARRLRKLARDIENAARRKIGWPEI